MKIHSKQVLVVAVACALAALAYAWLLPKELRIRDRNASEWLELLSAHGTEGVEALRLKRLPMASNAHWIAFSVPLSYSALQTHGILPLSYSTPPTNGVLDEFGKLQLLTNGWQAGRYRFELNEDGGTKVLLNVSDFAPGEYSVSLKLIISGRSGERAIVIDGEPETYCFPNRR